jgi:hypothetical protein
MNISDPQSILNFLAGMPTGHATANKDTLQEIMTTTGGQLMARGHLYEIKQKHLGVGVYRVYLSRWTSPSS